MMSVPGALPQAIAFRALGADSRATPTGRYRPNNLAHGTELLYHARATLRISRPQRQTRGT